MEAWFEQGCQPKSAQKYVRAWQARLGVGQSCGDDKDAAVGVASGRHTAAMTAWGSTCINHEQPWGIPHSPGQSSGNAGYSRAPLISDPGRCRRLGSLPEVASGVCSILFATAGAAAQNHSERGMVEAVGRREKEELVGTAFFCGTNHTAGWPRSGGCSASIALYFTHRKFRSTGNTERDMDVFRVWNAS